MLLTIANLTQAGRNPNFQQGDVYQLSLTGAPANTQLDLNVNGTYQLAIGTTDGNGNWTMSGRLAARDVDLSPFTDFVRIPTAVGASSNLVQFSVSAVTTALDLVTDAMLEIGAVAAGEVPSNEDAQFCLRKGNRMLDEWAARKVYAYNVAFTPYTLVSGLSPHTIGPSGTFKVAQRPVRLEGCSLILNNLNQNVDVPMNIRDDAWWNEERVKSLQSTVPTDVYYSPDFPNGSLYFWPVPNFAYGVRLETWGILTRLSGLTQAFQMPPAYWNAIVTSLAERIASAFEKPVSASLAEEARNARKALQSNNQSSPRIASADYGMRGHKGNRPTFNYYSGQ